MIPENKNNRKDVVAVDLRRVVRHCDEPIGEESMKYLGTNQRCSRRAVVKMGHGNYCTFHAKRNGWTQS